MALNSSGPISLAGTTAGQSIELENGGNGTTQISLNDAAVRTLAGVPSGAITMPTNFYGKSNRVALSYTFSTNTANASLNVSSIGGYSSGKSDITITVNSGIYVYSTSTGTPGLTISGGATGDTITLVNNGYIMGMGGAGGKDNPSTNPPQSGVTAPGAGGNAINISGIGISSMTINNTNASAYIGGGGGGGSGAYYLWRSPYVNTYNQGNSGGGGAGGGAGGNYDVQRDVSCNIILYTYSGGSGGSVGSAGTNGQNNGGAPNSYGAPGGGGGRIFPGTGGASSTISANSIVLGKGGGSGGSGGGGAFSFCCSTFVGSGGGGGGWGASGGGAAGTDFNGTSPGSNYAGGSGSSAGSGSGSGGAGGKAVNLGGKTVTWTSGNTTRVYGAIS